RKPHSNRLYDRIQDKCVVYKDTAESEGVPYVIGLYGDFDADVQLEEVQECLYDQETGLFNSYPEVSGVLFFNDNFIIYLFVYLLNHRAKRPYNLPNGIFDLRLKPQ